MRLNYRAAWIGLVAALPFTSLASFAWYQGEKGIDRAMNYEGGDVIYWLGSPLTQIPRYIGYQFQDSDNWWATPVMNALFTLQWIAWAQLLACGWRKINNPNP